MAKAGEDCTAKSLEGEVTKEETKVPSLSEGKAKLELLPSSKDKTLEMNPSASSDFFTSLMQNLQIQNAPKVDIDCFSGNILEYQYFVATFREVVERCVPDERGRLARLIQHTSGEAKELIRHCIHDNPTSCYSNAMSLLRKQYGDPHRISVAYLKELRNWPMIKGNDSSAFRAFNRLLIKLSI